MDTECNLRMKRALVWKNKQERNARVTTYFFTDLLRASKPGKHHSVSFVSNKWRTIFSVHKGKLELPMLVDETVGIKIVHIRALKNHIDTMQISRTQRT